MATVFYDPDLFAAARGDETVLPLDGLSDWATTDALGIHDFVFRGAAGYQIAAQSATRKGA